THAHNALRKSATHEWDLRPGFSAAFARRRIVTAHGSFPSGWAEITRRRNGGATPSHATGAAWSARYPGFKHTPFLVQKQGIDAYCDSYAIPLKQPCGIDTASQKKEPWTFLQKEGPEKEKEEQAMKLKEGFLTSPNVYHPPWHYRFRPWLISAPI